MTLQSHFQRESLLISTDKSISVGQAAPPQSEKTCSESPVILIFASYRSFPAQTWGSFLALPLKLHDHMEQAWYVGGIRYPSQYLYETVNSFKLYC